jgi:hypothetical protein
LERPERLRVSLDGALRFIDGSINPQGFWSDFLTLAGESVYWVTGYVGYALAQGSAPHGEERRRLLLDVGSRLLAHQDGGGGWGYGPGVPADADSTSWCLLFLSEMQMLDRDSLEKASLILLKHQSPSDGGFRTYAAPREIGRYMMLDESVSFEGWASSQTCVTAAAAQALIKTGSPRGVERALEHIRRTQTAEGHWNAYWWTDALYSTVLCMEALVSTGPGWEGDAGDAVLLDRARAWIERTQLAGGGWNADSDGWPFSTALALRGLMLGSGSIKASDTATAIGRGVEWLLTHQLADGSWGDQHILRIPHPSDKEPWTQARWARDGRAIGAAIKDHRRLYTTATAFRALSEFERISSGDRDRGVRGDG